MEDLIKKAIDEISKKYEHVTKRSHFVKQEYLMKWSGNNKNILVSINSCDFKKDTPRNICNEKYMYKLEEFTKEEMAFLKHIYSLTPEPVKTVNDSFLNEWQLCCSLAKQAENSKNSELFKKMLVQTGENLQSSYESAYSKTIQDDLRNCKEDFLNDYNEKLNFAIFLFSQYLRTQKMKKRIIKNYESFSEEIKQSFKAKPDKLWKAMITILTNAASYTMLIKENVHIKFIKNSSKSFLTSDQPIINIGKVNNNEDQFYFPISPEIAIIFPSEKNEVIIDDKDIIDKYNQVMKLESERFVIKYYDRNS